MKRKIALLLVAASLTLNIYGCGSEGSEDVQTEKKAVVTPTPTVSDVLEEKTSSEASTVDISVPQPNDSAAAGSSFVPVPEAVPEGTVLSSVEGVDVDLTTLSSTMVYGQVYNMVFFPENYIGKTIRMEGIYTEYYDQAKGRYYFACFIMDATACCSQGIEFEPTSDFKYPDDYPTEGDDVIVEGVFEVYEEDGYKYCTLRNAKFITG